MTKLKELKGFVVLNETEVTAVQGGILAKQCSCCGDVDSDSGDSYENDKIKASGTVGNN